MEAKEAGEVVDQYVNMGLKVGAVGTGIAVVWKGVIPLLEALVAAI